jgi:hypothetical protein
LQNIPAAAIASPARISKYLSASYRKYRKTEPPQDVYTMQGHEIVPTMAEMVSFKKISVVTMLKSLISSQLDLYQGLLRVAKWH